LEPGIDFRSQFLQSASVEKQPISAQGFALLELLPQACPNQTFSAPSWEAKGEQFFRSSVAVALFGNGNAAMTTIATARPIQVTNALESITTIPLACPAGRSGPHLSER
jgi:hypothetical protein